ncbi:AI-2E family transporter [Thermomonas mangrovi]|uniref:AI-2E family transporter n=1 Tax=Thermomonas mangrovi TaxID=2993316 RepID=UPI002306EF87|nr:AI-2E family transporter [Thermomonas mangrovi]
MTADTPPDAAPQPAPAPAAPTSAPSQRPRPRAPLSLVVLAVLAVGYTLWITQEVVLPVLLAMFFALVGNPIIRVLQRLHVPRFLGALAVLCGGIALAVLLAQQLVQPAGEWIREAPRELRSLAPKVQKLIKPVQEANKAAENIARAAGGENTARPAQVVKTEVNDPYRSLTATPMLVASILAVVLLTFFFMVFGQDLQRKAIALLPDRQKKKLTVEILQAIETEVSRYVLTISIINAVVGLVFAAALHLLLGVPIDEALLWGTMAALLNFAPYVGPLIGIVAMLLMGFASYDAPLQALAPAAIYLGLHTLEGQIVTPIVLGRTMAISPLVLILGLMVFGSLWGIVGLLLAVPLLVCVKIVLARVEGMEGWARLLE